MQSIVLIKPFNLIRSFLYITYKQRDVKFYPYKKWGVGGKRFSHAEGGLSATSLKVGVGGVGDGNDRSLGCPSALSNSKDRQLRIRKFVRI